MSLDIAIREYSPLLRMSPAIIPCRLRKLGTRPINCFDVGYITDAIMIWGNTDDRAILLMEIDVVVLKLSFATSVKIP